MKDIIIYDGKSIELADWPLQIEKVDALTNSQAYKLARAKSTSTQYKMLKRKDYDLGWQEIKWKLEEVYSPVATEVHHAKLLTHKTMT